MALSGPARRGAPRVAADEERRCAAPPHRRGARRSLQPLGSGAGPTIIPEPHGDPNTGRRGLRVRDRNGYVTYLQWVWGEAAARLRLVAENRAGTP